MLVRLGLLGGGGGALLCIATVLLVWQLGRHPDWIARGLTWALGWPDDAIELGGFRLAPLAGRFYVEELRVDPPAANAPVVAMRAARADIPSPLKLWDREIDLGEVLVRGLDVHAKQQKPPAPLKVPEGLPIVLSADRVVFRAARYHAPDDPPMKEVVIQGIDGTFQGVRWTPALRRIAGHGTVVVDDMVLGAIELSRVQLPDVELTGTSVHLGAGRFVYGETVGFARGRIDQIDRRPAVNLHVRVEGERVERAVQTATGATSPVVGRLTASLELRSGGELARGAARFAGWMRLEGASFYVGQDLRLIPRALLDLAPWFSREGGGWLDIGDLRGEATFGRGWVDLARLERPSDKHRVLQAWGELADGAVELTIRAVPRRRPNERAGIGLHVEGPLSNLRLRFARREELERAPPVFP